MSDFESKILNHFKDGSIKPQGVDYSKIVVHLVAAIQELKATVDAQAAEIAALKAKVPA